MLTKSGVKLLDFGLAKALEPNTPAGVTAFPTKTALTHEGTILGTRQKGRTDLKLASLRRDKIDGEGIEFRDDEADRPAPDERGDDERREGW